MATLAAGFVRFLGFLFPIVATPLFSSHIGRYEFTFTTAQPIAALIVVIVTAVNFFSVRMGGAIQVLLVLREPNRWFKVSMTSLALMVVYAGMLKYRGDLNTVIYGNQRYLFAGSIFFIWLLCLNAATFKPIFRYSLIALVIVGEIKSFVRWRQIEKISIDRHWSQWAEKIERGEPAVVPIDPTWAITINSTEDKVITNYRSN